MVMKKSIILIFALFYLVACQSNDNAATTTPLTTVAATTVDTAPTNTPTLPPPISATETTTAVAATDTAVSPTETAVTSTDTPEPEPTTIPASAVSSISLEPVVQNGLTRPLYLTHAGDERLFVVEQRGIVRIIKDGELLSAPFLNIDGLVGDNANEQGLLSLAFDPAYAENGRFFVNYTNNQGRTVISRFQVSDDANTADADSEVILLTVSQPFGNHNGGQLHFGPDGYLYVGMGDGGSGGDPQGNGQNSSTLLGSLLRLDVSGDEYTTPDNNPFSGDAGLSEIWAIGLRNPWRFSFDRLTGDIYIADVGQSIWEEVSFQTAASSGGENYGWNIMEGAHCYQSTDCDSEGLQMPIFEYNHDLGCSVTGGYIYRGQQFPELQGNYFVADYCTGIIWSLFQEADGSWTNQQVLDSDLVVASFGEDAAGELYMIDHNGSVWQIRP
jgi:glucose/arabinose dehydrogenase